MRIDPRAPETALRSRQTAGREIARPATSPPETPQAAPLTSLNELNGAFLELALERLGSQSCTQYIDLASGALAGDYRRLCPPGSRVVYQEPRWEMMASLRPRLDQDSAVLCLEQPLAEIDDALIAAHAFFGASRKVIVCHLGAASFIDDSELRHVMHRLYDWCAPNSSIAVSMLTSDELSPELEDALALAREMGQPMYIRTAKQCAQLLKPWRLLEPGLLSLIGWCVEQGRLAPEAAAGLTGDLTGALLTKPVGGMR